MDPKPRRTILFVAEAVTLAHLGRPIVLGEALDPTRYDRVLACDHRYARFFPKRGWRCEPLESIGSAQFTAELARGRPVFSLETLRRYARADADLIERIAPALVVGDFRLSLSVSARLAGVPYAAIANAYWSPYVDVRHVIPSHRSVRIVGLAVADTLFRIARPAVFGWHARPLNRLRLENGLPSLGLDLRRVYTDADVTLYADSPALFTARSLPPSHRFIGPVSWSPEVAAPASLEEGSADDANVYVTLGSSGQAGLLPIVLEALSTLPCKVFASTAGAPVPSATPANASVFDYLPGRAMAQRSRLVVCNGGSPATYQALLAGSPVLGIADNLDQFLNMGQVVAAGAGKLVRSDRATVHGVREAAQMALEEPSYRSAAGQMAGTLGREDAAAVFADIVGSLFG